MRRNVAAPAKAPSAGRSGPVEMHLGLQLAGNDPEQVSMWAAEVVDGYTTRSWSPVNIRNRSEHISVQSMEPLRNMVSPVTERSDIYGLQDERSRSQLDQYHAGFFSDDTIACELKTSPDIVAEEYQLCA